MEDTATELEFLDMLGDAEGELPLALGLRLAPEALPNVLLLLEGRLPEVACLRSPAFRRGYVGESAEGRRAILSKTAFISAGIGTL